MRRLVAVVLLAVVGPAARADDAFVIPDDAVGFLTADVAAVLKSPTAELGKLAFDGLKPGEWAAFVKKFAADPATVERVTVLFPTGESLTRMMATRDPLGTSALLAVECDKAFDADAMRKGYAADGRVKAYLGQPYGFDEKTWTAALVLPGSKTVLFGSEDAVLWYVERMKAAETGPTFKAAVAESRKHALFAAANPAAFGLKRADVPADLRVLLDAKLATIRIDLTPAVKIAARLEYATAAGARDGLEGLKVLATMVRILIGQGIAELESLAMKGRQPYTPKGEQPPPPPANKPLALDAVPERMTYLLGLGALRRADKELENLPLEVAGSSVRLTYDKVALPDWSVPVLLTMGGAALMAELRYSEYRRSDMGFQKGGPNDQPDKRAKKLAEAFEAYREKNGAYPPAAITDKKGEPLLSWRVALLPFLGEEKLYEQFKLDEPWDSPTNKKLLAKMPSVYAPGSDYDYYSQGRYLTRTVVVVGPGTLFEKGVEVKKADVKGREGQIVLTVEPSNVNGRYGFGVFWTKPADIAFDPAKPPQLFDNYEFASFPATYLDGSVKLVTKKDWGNKLAELFARKPKKKED